MPFPTLGILDTGTRANEDPLSHGGDWTSDDAANPLIISSNKIVPKNGAGAVCSSFWQAGSAFGPDMEVYFTVSTFGSTGEDFRVLLRWTGTVAGGSGYEGRVYANFNGGGPSNGWVILARVDAGTRTTIASNFNLLMEAGQQFGVEMIGSTIKLYQGSTSRLSVTDGAYTAAGKFGLRMTKVSTGSAINFGGGQLSAAAGVTQAQLDGASMRGIDRGVQRGMARRLVTTNWKRHGSGLFVPAFTGLIAQPAR